MQPLRFAIVTTNYPPFAQGGDGRPMQWLARALAQRGHLVEVVHDTDEYRRRTGLVPPVPERDHGIRVHRLRGGSQSQRQRIASRLKLRKAPSYHARLREILTGRFDVTLFHDVGPLGGPAVWSLGSGIRLHWTSDYEIVCPKRDLMRRKFERCAQPACVRCQLAHGRLPEPRVADQRDFRRNVRSVDAFLVQSQMIRQRLAAAGFEHRMDVVPPFLPTSAPLLKAAEAPVQARPFFLFDGTLCAGAALDEALGQYSDDLEADFIVLTEGPVSGSAARLARAQDNIKILGPTSQIARQALYREALAVVLPKEDGGRVPLSALAASREGTPVIAAGGTSGAEFVMETGGGYRHLTLPELRAIFYRLAHDPAHAQELGRRAFGGHARMWREDVAVDRFFDSIRDAAARRGLIGLLAKLEPEEARHA